MENERNQRRFESVYSKKVRAGKRRTYFFDVRRTKGDDFYLTLTESTKRFNGEGYERHKIFLYKEDFNRFLASLEDVINHVKSDLMPEYDYDEFTRRNEEWEAKRAEDDDDMDDDMDEDDMDDEDDDSSVQEESIQTEDDITW
ncbi:MAG: DUF3276 family protein [Phaeodactylibacter sp.]|nr:DUF3276 family protein [Phaeodactylibacter sp.]